LLHHGKKIDSFLKNSDMSSEPELLRAGTLLSLIDDATFSGNPAGAWWWRTGMEFITLL